MKSEIRKIIIEKRKKMSCNEVSEKSRAAAEFFLKSDLYKNSGRIMLYMPLGNETDTDLIVKTAFKDGKKVSVPVTERETGLITPYLITEKTVFEKGNFSIKEPVNAEKADMATTEVVIVPGVAFDKKGARIGFGKGCYDKFLKNLEVVKVGFCYEFQLIDDGYSEPHDIRMDYMITENGLYKTTE